MNINEFNHKVLPLGAKLYRFASRLLQNPDEVQDAMQEVFLKLWSIRKKLSEVKSIEAMSVTITKNHCLDRLRNRKFNTPVTDSNLGINTLTPGKQTELSDSIEQVNRLINELPEQQRMIIQLRDVEEYSFEEIVEITGMSIEAIRTALSRSRKKIRESLKKAHNYEVRIY